MSNARKHPFGKDDNATMIANVEFRQTYENL